MEEIKENGPEGKPQSEAPAEASIEPSIEKGAAADAQASGEETVAESALVPGASEPEAPVETPAETEAGETAVDAASTPKLAPEDENKRWYIVHTYSGYEQKVKLSIMRLLETYKQSKKARDKRIASYFGEILIPTENVVELVKGKRKTTSRKFFPGYILVQMEDNEESRHFVRETPKVSGFVGGSREPTPISGEELDRIHRQQTEGAERPKPKVQFEHGESIRVIHGPFANFTGVVEDVKPEKGKVRVLVTIFGRATPVELSFVEVEKT